MRRTLDGLIDRLNRRWVQKSGKGVREHASQWQYALSASDRRLFLRMGVSFFKAINAQSIARAHSHGSVSNLPCIHQETGGEKGEGLRKPMAYPNTLQVRSTCFSLLMINLLFRSGQPNPLDEGSLCCRIALRNEHRALHSPAFADRFSRPSTISSTAPMPVICDPSPLGQISLPVSHPCRTLLLAIQSQTTRSLILSSSFLL